jgi:hypothetical protein
MDAGIICRKTIVLRTIEVECYPDKHISAHKTRPSSLFQGTLAMDHDLNSSRDSHPDDDTSVDLKKPWVDPEVQELPRLTDLTLQSGDPIGGGFTPGGGTVF